MLVVGEGNTPAVDRMLRDGSRRRQFRQDFLDSIRPFDDWNFGILEIQGCIGREYVGDGGEVQSIEGDRVICRQLLDPVDIADDWCTERCL